MGGRLERELAQQKRQTRTGTLTGVSKEERRRRDAEGRAEVVNYN